MNNFHSNSKVSVVAANYNNGKYLEDFLTSLENSSLLPCEVVIADDCSTDNSVEILKGYKGNLRLTCIFLEENVGFSEALNRAVSVSKGTYLLRIDPDDIIHPLRLETQLKYLLFHPEIDLVGSNVIYFQQSSKRKIYSSSVPVNFHEIKKSLLKGDIPLIHSSLMGKKEVFERFPYKLLKFPVEDYCFFAELLKNNVRLANLKEKLTYVRIHHESASGKIKIDRIREIFEIREKYFGLRISKIQLWSHFLHVKYYRKFLSSQNQFKLFWLFLSAIMRPSKVIKRFAHQ